MLHGSTGDLSNIVSTSYLTVDTRNNKPQALSWTHVPRDSRQNIKAIQTWLNNCRTEHNQCLSFQDATVVKSDRPTRILDLSNERIRLQCDFDRISNLEYLTLSHVWGKDPSRQLRLVEDRVAEFQEEILDSGMSHIYIEAIRITRALGFQFLWIDSLCIIQDSEEDWTREASRIAAVYGNATCTLSYIFPPEGPFERPRKDPRNSAPCILRQPSDMSKGIYVGHRFPTTCDGLDLRRYPLFKRAWVMQERLLSTRTVYLGLENLVWECCQLLSDELFGSEGLSAWPTFAATPFTKADFATKAGDIAITTAEEPARSDQGGGIESSPKFFYSWNRLCTKYSGLQLTKESDRSIAIAGIAEAMHKAHGLTYLAGIWKEDFQFGLLWNVSSLSWGLERRFDKHSCDIPSWSWLSRSPVEDNGTNLFAV